MNEGIFTLYTKCVLKFFLDSKGKIKTLKRQLKKWRNFGLAGKGRGTDKQKLMVEKKSYEYFLCFNIFVYDFQRSLSDCKGFTKDAMNSKLKIYLHKVFF